MVFARAARASCPACCAMRPATDSAMTCLPRLCHSGEITPLATPFPVPAGPLIETNLRPLVAMRTAPAWWSSKGTALAGRLLDGSLDDVDARCRARDGIHQLLGCPAGALLGRDPGERGHA